MTPGFESPGASTMDAVLTEDSSTAVALSLVGIRYKNIILTAGWEVQQVRLSQWHPAMHQDPGVS